MCRRGRRLEPASKSNSAQCPQLLRRCKETACLGGCPAEEIVMGASSCATYPDIVPVCRLWKSSAKLETV